MDLKERLNILKTAGSIDNEIYENVIEVIGKFTTNWNIELNEENGAMLITHLATALARIKKGEAISHLDESILEELKSYEKYYHAEEILKDMVSIVDSDIPESEEQYLMMHVCSLLQK